MEILELVVAGSGRERGLQHGRAYPELIKGCFERFCEFEGITTEQIEGILQKIEDSLRGGLSEVLEEIKGIAQGSDMSYEEIMQLNFCEEIWNKTTGWCTGICLTQPRHGPLLGKTSDVGEGDKHFHIFQRVANCGGYRFIRCTFVGTVWTCAGINEAGLALAASDVKPKDWGKEGLPGGLLLQVCLQRCATVEEAKDIVYRSSIMGTGANFMFADAQKNAVVVEKCPTAQALRYPEDGVIFQTNHYVSEEMNGLLVDDQEWMDNSRARYELLSQITKSMPRTRLGMENLLRHHDGTRSICQHGGAGGRFHTIAAYVISPEQEEMWVAHGRPCDNRFVRFSI